MRNKVKSRSRRAIPAVNKILDSLGEQASPARTDLPRPLIVDVVREELAQIRRQREIPEFDAVVDLVRDALEKLRVSRIQPVINGTGIIIHTNRGRSPLPQGAGEVLRNVASSYNNLELDLATGDRGERAAYLERALAALCHAEAATTVNNCAAAMVLIVRYFTQKKNEVIISRGELLQIGGGFRIGEILESSGAKLREVGATNKTTLADYARAIGKSTALILKVHRSNFFMSGFVASTSTADLASLAHKHRLPLVEDLGSGAITPTEQIGLHHHEPTPAESLKAGADLICFSGDKLFGGPQAGIIVGKQKVIAALKREPLFRALRCDKLTLAALQTTVDIHLNQVTSEIPSLALLQMPKDELRARAAPIVTRLQGLPLKITIGAGTGKAGGGTLPRSIVPSITLDLLPQNCSVEEFAQALRQSSPPVVSYVANGRIKLDLRTIFSHQDDLLVDAIRTASTKSHHEDFVRNMIAGVGSIDLALLVVAADDGWMPQTEEHLQILTYLGVKRIVVALTKSDLGKIDIVKAKIREHLRETPFVESPIVPTSVRTGEGLENLKSALASEFAALLAPRDIGKPRLFVDRAFKLQGIGTVVTGTLTGGTLRAGDPVSVQPQNVPARIRSLQTHGRDVDLVQPGTRTAMNLPDLEVGVDVKRGDVITTQQLEPSSTLDIVLSRSARIPRAASIKSGASAYVHHGTTRVLARIILAEKGSLAVGQTAVAQLRLGAPLLAFVGDRLIVRDASEQQTIAGGVVFNVDSRDFRSSQERALLATRTVAPDDVALAVWTEIARTGLIEPARLLERSRFNAAEIAEALRRLGEHGEIFLADNVGAKMVVWRDLRKRAATVVDTAHRAHPERRGLELTQLRAELNSLSPAAFDALIVDLCREEFVRLGSTIARHSHRATF